MRVKQPEPFDPNREYRPGYNSEYADRMRPG